MVFGSSLFAFLANGKCPVLCVKVLSDRTGLPLIRFTPVNKNPLFRLLILQV